jgi:membrane-associated phospholipid phosphatase
MKKNGLVVFLVLVWIIFAIIFGIYDLEISKQIVNQNSSLAKFLQDYGMIPGIFVLLSGIYIYYSFIKIKSDAWSYIQRVVFFLVSSGLIFHLGEIIIGNFATNNFLVFLIISFAISLLVIIALHFKSQVQNILAVRYAKVVVGVALFGYVILIQGIKYFWGRVRFRELDAAFSQFTPWYLPQGITGFDSFPSGHAAMGWMLLPLLIFLSTKKEWIQNVSFVLIFIWGVILASSRVVIGAHYASDVLFGSFFIIITFLIFIKIHYRIDQQKSNL